jgi:diacylglycerol kinase (ATP)
MRIDLVLNRRARAFERRPELLARMADVARGRCALHATASPDELAAVACELAARGTDLVLLAGGDGSLMAGTTALVRAFGADLPPISPVPAGTAGTIARNWGIAGDPVECLARVLERPRRLVPRPSLRVREEGVAGVVERTGFIVGTGLVARFFGVYYERGAPGYQGSAKLVARIFLESFVGGPLAARVLDPLPCELHVDGERLDPEAWSLVCCATIKNLGIHMLLTYRGGDDPSRPHLVATPMTPRQLGPRAPWVLAGKSFGGPGHVDRLVGSFSIRFAESGPYVLDGELLSAHEVTVSAGPLLTIATPS